MISGVVRQTMVICVDGYIVAHSVERVTGGPLDGKYLVRSYRPKGKGARSGRAPEHLLVYERGFKSLKMARRWFNRHLEQHGGRKA